MNPFEKPKYYRSLILTDAKLDIKPDQFKGKSFICLSLTKYCPVGCSFCFFKSKSPTGIKTIHDTLNEDAVNKVIKFADDCNLGYLLISGGGEPFIEFESLVRILEEIKSDKISIVTSGYWAKNIENAEKRLDTIYKAIGKRKTKSDIVIRLSVDEEHNKEGRFGLDPAVNLIKIFSSKYRDTDSFTLQFHSLLGDSKVSEIERIFKNEIIDISQKELASDGITADKITPLEKIIKFRNGFRLKICFGKVFHSDVKVNLNDPKVVSRNVQVFDKDMAINEEGNPSTVSNLKTKEKGLDFWITYNGNVTTWGNQVLDNLFNIYVDTYDDLVKGSFRDPLIASYIEKGNVYRDEVISEVNPRAVLRTKAVNIRDYTGAIVFEEEKTRLYYSIRALQDYIQEGDISPESVNKWPTEVRQLVDFSKDDLKKLYNDSSYSILDQYNEDTFNEQLWINLFELTRLGHFEVSEEKLKSSITAFNKKSRKEYLQQGINEDFDNHAYQDMITAIKPEVLKEKVAT